MKTARSVYINSLLELVDIFSGIHLTLSSTSAMVYARWTANYSARASAHNHPLIRGANLSRVLPNGNLAKQDARHAFVHTIPTCARAHVIIVGRFFVQIKSTVSRNAEFCYRAFGCARDSCFECLPLTMWQCQKDVPECCRCRHRASQARETTILRNART